MCCPMIQSAMQQLNRAYKGYFRYYRALSKGVFMGLDAAGTL